MHPAGAVVGQPGPPVHCAGSLDVDVPVVQVDGDHVIGVAGAAIGNVRGHGGHVRGLEVLGCRVSGSADGCASALPLVERNARVGDHSSGVTISKLHNLQWLMVHLAPVGFSGPS